MTPSQAILAEGLKTSATFDKKGRKIVIRYPTALDTLRLFKAAGPVLAQNEPWLAMAMLAFAVQEIDGVPIPSPSSESQIENLIDRLGDEGLAAVAAVVSSVESSDNMATSMGNLPSIQF